MVERQPPPGGAAVDAPPAVTREKRPAGDLPLHDAGDPDVVDEADHMRPTERVRGRAEWSIELLDHLCLALEHQYVGAAQ